MLNLKLKMKKFAIEIKWGIRYFFAYLLWVYVEKMSGYYSEKIGDYLLYSLLFYFIAIFIYVLAINDKKKNYFNNNMDWKQGAVTGIFMTIVIAILMPLCQIVIHKGMAPEFFPNMIENSVLKGSKLEDAKAYFNLSSYIFQSVFSALSFGVVISAIVAYFLQTKNLKK